MSLQPDQIALHSKRFPIVQVKVDFRKLLSSMGQALTHATFAYVAPDPVTASGSAVNAGAAIFGSVEAFEANAPLEVRAWYLVRSALAGALGELLAELHGVKGPFEGDLKHLENRFKLLLERNDAVIDANFLENPRTLKLLPKVCDTLESWLSSKVGLSPGEARSLTNRIPAYLAPALRDESRAHRDYYKPIIDHFHDPFAYAAQMEWDWERNRLELVRQMDLPVFEEKFSLRQIYVPLRAYFREEIESGEALRHEREHRCTVVMLHEEVERWLATAAQEHDDIRLITGGPGSGKSTFAKWLAAELSEKRRMRVLFFPLQRFRIEKRLDEAIARYLTTSGRFRQSPLGQEGFASPNDPLLLIFDGLDELTKPGDLADEQTRLFIEELRHSLGLWNSHKVAVLALITGRTVYAQAKRPLLRISDRQEIAVLPYFIEDSKRAELSHHEELEGEELLKEDQREQWWQNYSRAKGLNDGSLPDLFKSNRDLCELTADPLLNYLVVLSGFHTELAGDAEVNRNRIYARLVKDVVDRRHAKRSKTDRAALAAVDDAGDRENFERLLETVALAAWYGDGRTTTLADVKRLCPSDLRSTLDNLLTGGPGFTWLIAAFYIRQVEAAAETSAVEFTHKSFGEYLTARRLVREIRRIDRGLRESPEYFSVNQALYEWCTITSKQAIDEELLHFIDDEITLQSEEDASNWHENFNILLNYEIRNGFCLTALSGNNSRSVAARARNAEEALLLMMIALSKKTKIRAQVSWPDERSAAELLSRLSSSVHAVAWFAYVPRSWYSNRPGPRDWSFFDFSGQRLYCADLSFLVLDNCCFRGGIMIACRLTESRLVNTDLTSAFLSIADLMNTDLTGADLRGADLAQAYLNEADLSGANLSGANLNGADLSGAKDLTREQIKSARDIRGAKLPDHLKDLA